CQYDLPGGDVRLSHPFQQYWRWNTSYRLSNDQISHVIAGDTVLEQQKGTRTTSAVLVGVTRDSRDNFQAPTKGGLSSFTADLAGFGGDSKYIKLLASTTYFKPIWFGHILSGRLEGGYGFGWAADGLTGKTQLPLFERFYLGGPNTVRSFKPRLISPIDSGGQRIGGDTYHLANVEYI